MAKLITNKLGINLKGLYNFKVKLYCFPVSVTKFSHRIPEKYFIYCLSIKFKLLVELEYRVLT